MTPLAAGAVLVMKATAFGLGCDAPGPYTKAGTTPVEGHTIAADPRVLPIGSIVEIEGLGVRQVHDIGGGVRGRHVDVFMDDCRAARRWGVQRRVVRVVHIPVVSAQAPRRAPDHPGAGRLSLDRSALLTVGREEGSARAAGSRPVAPGRAAPAARSLGGGGGDPRETWRLTMLLAALLSAAACGTLVLILLAVLDPKARAEALAAVRLWWALLREGGSAEVAEWRFYFHLRRALRAERRAARTVGHSAMGVHAPQWCAKCSAGRPMNQWVTWPCSKADWRERREARGVSR